MKDDEVARMTDFCRTPWTDDQVRNLNDYQSAGYMHPFTCADSRHEIESPTLVAYNTGWQCPDPECDYIQDWAHDFMTKPRPPASSYFLNLGGILGKDWIGDQSSVEAVRRQRDEK